MSGRSILQIIAGRLDEEIDWLMVNEEESDDRTLHSGRAQGLAEAVAIIENPYHPSMDAVREAAMERWEMGHG